MNNGRGLFIEHELAKCPWKFVMKLNIRYLKVENICLILGMCISYFEKGRLCICYSKSWKDTSLRSGECVFSRGEIPW